MLLTEDVELRIASTVASVAIGYVGLQLLGTDGCGPGNSTVVHVVAVGLLAAAALGLIGAVVGRLGLCATAIVATGLLMVVRFVAGASCMS